VTVPHDDDVARALAAWRQGDDGAVDELFHLVYGELRVLARRHLRRGQPGHTLGPTALVHEVYLRLAQRSSPNILDRDQAMLVPTEESCSLRLPGSRRALYLAGTMPWDLMTSLAAGLLRTFRSSFAASIDLDPALMPAVNVM
jgi:ECF sigma factor